MTLQFETIGQLIKYTYGGLNQVTKDAPVLTTTTGVFNPIFGAMAFSQLNNEANAFGLLPKYPWQHSGYRAITADAGTTADGGIAENGTIPATIKPTFIEITVPTKQVSHTFDVSFIQEGKVKKGDDAIGDMEFLRGYGAMLHAKRINEQLLRDVDTTVTNGFDSIDRVCCSKSEEDGCVTAGDGDIYGIDRSDVGYSWADAQVGHASGTDRTLTTALMETVAANVETAGGRTNLILTGSDTKWRIFALYESQVRYAGVVKRDQAFSVGINGVETDEGQNAGTRVATWYGIPMFISQAVTKDTISRIYFLDTTLQDNTGIPRLGISLMWPTMYFESGMSAANPDPFAINRFGTECVYYTAGEIVCTFFAAQGKLRDLK